MKNILTALAIAAALLMPTLAAAHDSHDRHSHEHHDNRDGKKHKKHKKHKHKKDKHIHETHVYHHVDEAERLRTIELNKTYYIKLH